MTYNCFPVKICIFKEQNRMEDNNPVSPHTQSATQEATQDDTERTTSSQAEELPPVEVLQEELKIYKSLKKSIHDNHVAPVFVLITSRFIYSQRSGITLGRSTWELLIASIHTWERMAMKMLRNPDAIQDQ